MLFLLVLCYEFVESHGILFVYILYVCIYVCIACGLGMFSRTEIQTHKRLKTRQTTNNNCISAVAVAAAVAVVAVAAYNCCSLSRL